MNGYMLDVLYRLDRRVDLDLVDLRVIVLLVFSDPSSPRREFGLFRFLPWHAAAV